MNVLNATKDAITSHILLVHQNRMGLVARKSVLEELGHTVTTVSNPQEGLEQFANTLFDLVITDYRMPLMNGAEMIRQMRLQRAAVPVILLSGMVDALGLTEENTGADVVIAKSNLEVQQMTRAVNRLLRRRLEKKPVRSQGGTRRPKAHTV